jgi:hypothetical protein
VTAVQIESRCPEEPARPQAQSCELCPTKGVALRIGIVAPPWYELPPPGRGPHGGGIRACLCREHLLASLCEIDRDGPGDEEAVRWCLLRASYGHPHASRPSRDGLVSVIGPVVDAESHPANSTRSRPRSRAATHGIWRQEGAECPLTPDGSPRRGRRPTGGRDASDGRRRPCTVEVTRSARSTTLAQRRVRRRRMRSAAPPTR